MGSHNGSIHTTHTPPPLSFYNTFKLFFNKLHAIRTKIRTFYLFIFVLYCIIQLFCIRHLRYSYIFSQFGKHEAIDLLPIKCFQNYFEYGEIFNTLQVYSFTELLHLALTPRHKQYTQSYRIRGRQIPVLGIVSVAYTQRFIRQLTHRYKAISTRPEAAILNGGVVTQQYKCC